MCNQAPPRSVQLRFISNLQKELTVSTDLWEYAVSHQWVAALQEFIEAEESSGISVPPLTASDSDDNNLYVGEKRWVVLASWYGIDRQYSFRRKCTVSNYIDTSLPSDRNAAANSYVLADNKLDFITSYCCLLKDLGLDSKQPYINIYFWESLDFIEFQIRCALKVHPVRDVRLWLSLKDDGTDVLLENLSFYDRHRSSVGIVLCQKYPDILDALQKRQATPAYPYPNADPRLTSKKDDLSIVFISNEWQLTLCLEVLSPAVSTESTPLSCTSGDMMPAVPKVFCNLSLDHIFQDEAQCSNWDEEIRKLLDDSVAGFKKLIGTQKDRLQTRSEELLKKARESYQLQEQQLKKKMEETSIKENRLSVREKELNERDHELNSKLAKFKSMLTEFLTKKAKFEEEVSQLAAQNAITASKAELNVGGVRYTTSVQTLVKEEGSVLQLMFSGQHSITPDSDGSYFIDRDGTYFRHILNFLRDGPASLQHLPQDDNHLMSVLCAEAEHFKLHRMVDALKTKILESKAGANFASLPS